MRHFLRHKYIDPMTGKDEWRLIHIQGGVLVDSVLTRTRAFSEQQRARPRWQLHHRQGAGTVIRLPAAGASPAEDRRRAKGR